MSTGQGFIGYNMFAYCGNNPVVRTDTSGCWYYTENLISLPDPWDKYDRGVKMPEPNITDITEKLNVAMVDHAIELIEYSQVYSPIVVMLHFIDSSRSGGEWDLKSQEDWNLNKNHLYRYNDQLLRYDDIGNIHYGYVGRVLFDLDTLRYAAGVVQIISGTSDISYIDSYFDDPRDQWAISFGAQLWDYGG